MMETTFPTGAGGQSKATCSKLRRAYHWQRDRGLPACVIGLALYRGRGHALFNAHSARVFL